MATRLPKGYTPSEKEPFMNAKQKEFFRRKLLAWRNDIIQETKETLNNLQKEVVNFSDLADRASSETDAIKGMVKIPTPIPAAASVNPGA